MAAGEAMGAALARAEPAGTSTLGRAEGVVRMALVVAAAAWAAGSAGVSAASLRAAISASAALSLAFNSATSSFAAAASPFASFSSFNKSNNWTFKAVIEEEAGRAPSQFSYGPGGTFS